MQSLAQLKASYEAAHSALNNTIAAAFPGMDEWHWLRAVAHIEGDNCRRNDDTSNDEALASDQDIRAAWDNYITKLHAFYSLRDGPDGFLGSRERRASTSH